MAQSDDISAIDLGALLCSRVCHDIISPVGAINNGLEVLDEGGAEEMQEFAMDLIRKSAVQASAKLQFARIAFGAAGSAGAEVDTGEAQKVAEGYMAGEKATLTWTGERVLMAKNRVKLLLNLLLVANSMIPRGGTIDFSISGAVRRAGLPLSDQGYGAARAGASGRATVRRSGARRPHRARDPAGLYGNAGARLCDHDRMGRWRGRDRSDGRAGLTATAPLNGWRRGAARPRRKEHRTTDFFVGVRCPGIDGRFRKRIFRNNCRATPPHPVVPLSTPCNLSR